MRRVLISLLVLLFAADASAAGKQYTWDYTGNNPQGVVFDFESGRLENDGLSTRRLVADYSARIVSNTVREGRHAVRFELRTGDRVSDGWRAELRDLNNARPGDDVWYALSTFIPEDFPAEPSNSYTLTQWHDQKVPWNNPASHSPPLAHRYRNDWLDVTLRHAFEGMRDGDNGREVILHSESNFAKGTWHDFVYHIRWSPRADRGFVRAWRNGEQIIDYRGPVGYFDDLGPYVKFGIYARNNVRAPHVVYHDEYRRGQRYRDVCLNCDIAELINVKE